MTTPRENLAQLSERYFALIEQDDPDDYREAVDRIDQLADITARALSALAVALGVDR